jgi:hypothetical protein
MILYASLAADPEWVSATPPEFEHTSVVEVEVGQENVPLFPEFVNPPIVKELLFNPPPAPPVIVPVYVVRPPLAADAAVRVSV